MHPLSKLFLSLAEIYSAENRNGAKLAAKALIQASRNIDTPKFLENQFSKEVKFAINLNGHFLNKLLDEALPFIHWGGSDLREGRVPENLANQMPMCELIGPDGMYFEEDVRVGLWLQSKNIIYGPRQHEAEETFFIFEGEAEWWNEKTSNKIAGSGTYIFHPSNILHTSITKNQSILTTWRWSGEIGFDKYKLSKHHQQTTTK